MKMIRELATKLSAVALCLFMASAVGAQTYSRIYYVAPNGNDSNPGTEAAPFATIDKAITLCTADNYSELILVKPGVYTPIINAGANNRKFTIRSTDGADVTIIDGNYNARCALLWNTTGMIAPAGVSAQPAGNVSSAAATRFASATNTVLRGFTLRNGRVGSRATTTPANQPAGIGAVHPNNNWPSSTTTTTAYGGAGVRGGTVIDCVISNCLISGRAEGDYAAAAYNRLENCVITRNSQNGSTWFWAGGVFSSYVYGCTVTKNFSAEWGAGVDDCPVVMNSYIAENVSYGSGGSGVYGYYVKGYHENCTIVSNGSFNSNGGGYLHTVDAGNTTADNPELFINCVIAYNKGLNGGAAYTPSAVRTKFINCDIYENEAAREAGGIHSATLTDFAVKCRIYNNRGSQQSSGTYNAGGSYGVIHDRCEIFGNFTKGNGGGIYQGVAWSCLIYNNTANGQAGGVYSSVANSGVRGSVVFGNTAGSAPGGTYATQFVYNSIVYGNKLSGGGGSDRPTTAGTYAYSLTGVGSAAGTGIISMLDPVFYDQANANFRVRSWSPTLFQGSTSSTYVGSATTDMDEQSRPLQEKVTMGAYEVKYTYANFAGYDLTDGTSDDIVILPAATIYDLNNFVYRVKPTDNVSHRDLRAFDDGSIERLPAGTLIFDPRTIIRQGTSATAPAMTVEKTLGLPDTGDSFVKLSAGNSMDIDANGIPPIYFAKSGIYNQYTEVFTPDDGSPYALFPPGIIVDSANNRIIMPGPDYTLYSADDVVIYPATTADVDLLTGILTIKSGMTVTYGGTTVVETPPAGTLVTTVGVLIKPNPSGIPATDDNLIYQAGGLQYYHQPDHLLDHDGVVDLPVGAIVDLPTDEIPAVTIGVNGQYDTIRGIFKPRVPYDQQLYAYGSPIDNHVWALLPEGVRYNPVEVSDIVNTTVQGLVVPGPDCTLYTADDILIHGATVDDVDPWTGIITTSATDVKTEIYTTYLTSPSVPTASSATTLGAGEGGAVFAYRGNPANHSQYNRTVVMRGNSVTNAPTAKDGLLELEVYAGNHVMVGSGSNVSTFDADAYIPGIGATDGPYAMDPTANLGKVTAPDYAFVFDATRTIAAQIFTVTGDTATGETTSRTGERIQVMADAEPSYLYFGGGDWVPLATGTESGANTTTRTVKLPRYGQGNDIQIPGATEGDVDEYGRFTVTSQMISLRVGSYPEGGVVPSGSIIVSPDVIIRPGTGSLVSNNDGTINLAAGASIDTEGDGIAPWTVPVAGVYDTVTGVFTPAMTYWQYSEGRDGNFITHYTADGDPDGWRLRVVYTGTGSLVISSSTQNNRGPYAGVTTLPLADPVLYGSQVLPITGIAGDIASPIASPFVLGANLVTTITLPDTLATIGPRAFYGFTAYNTAFTIPASVTLVQDGAFENWTSYNQPFTWPASLTSIPAAAFKNWSAFNQDFTINEGVTSIGSEAFAGWNLYSKALEVPATVSMGGTSMFSGAFTKLIFKGGNIANAQIGTMSAATYASYVYRANMAGWDTQVGNAPISAGAAQWCAEPIYLIDPVVTLDLNYTGSTPTTATLTAGEPYGDALYTPVRSGYAFNSWTTTAAGGISVTGTDTATPPRDHTLYAQWAAGQQVVVINYVDDDNAGQIEHTDRMTGPSESAINFTPTNPNPDAWIIGNVEGPTHYDSDTETDQTITVHMTRKQTTGTITTTRTVTYTGVTTGNPPNVPQSVVWDTVTDQVSQQTTYTPRGNYAAVSSPAVTGYTASSDAALETLAVTTTLPQDSSVTVTYTPHAYSITYDGSGGTGATAGSSHTYDVSSALTLNGFAYAGYNFAGWTRTQGGTTAEYADGASVLNLTAASGGTVALYAVWSAAGNIPVHFSLNYDGSGTPPADMYVTFASAYGNLPAPTRTGYDLTGWYTQATGGTLVTGTDPVSNPNEHTLYARWSAKTVSVTFNYTDGATAPEAVTQTYDSNWILPATPTRAGFDFSGWFTTESGDGTMLTAATVFTTLTQTQVYARWVAKSDITATFDNNYANATPPQDIHQTFGAAYVLPTPTPTRTGYEFGGWYTDPVAGSLIPLTVENPSSHTNWAHWAAITGIQVTFDPHNGDATSTSSYTFDTPYVLPAQPSRTGYTFAGWWTGEASGSQITAGSLVGTAVNHTIHAQWTAITGIRVDFAANGGQPETLPHSEVTFGSPYGALPTVTRTAYNFAGWTYLGQPVTPATLVATVTPHTLLASWEASSGGVTVYFDGNGGTPTAPSKSATAGGTYGSVVTGTSATRTGYTFAGWFTAAQGGSQVLGTDTVPAVTETTLYAQWTAQQYTVSFNTHAAGVAAPGDMTVSYGAAYGTLPQVSRTGYDFDGWYTQEANGTLVTGATIVSATAGHTLHAMWTAKSFDVTFEATGNGTPANQAVPQTFDAFYVLPNVSPVRTGYTFAGWFTAAEGGTQVTAATRVATPAAHSLFSHWQAQSYNVAFRAGYSGADIISIGFQAFGAAYTLPASPARTGYTFKGWYTQEGTGGTEVTAATLINTAADHSVYAQWTAMTYAVTFDQDYDGAPANQVVLQTYDANYQLPATPSRTGYQFGGWFTGRNGGGSKIDTSSIVKVTDTTQVLYAKWEAEGNILVSFNANAGGAVADPAGKNVFFGPGGYGVLPTVARPGYLFTGWYTAAQGGTLVADNSEVTDNQAHTLHAHWAAQSYTVTYDLNYTPSDSWNATETFDTPYSRLTPAPSRTGYTFGGWFKDTALTLAAVSNTTAAAHSIYAKWTAKSVVVSFNPGYTGGASIADITQTFGLSYVLPANPARTGYDFSGWFNTSSQLITADTPVSVEDNHTLTARWAAKKYSVGFYLNYDGAPAQPSRDQTFDATYDLPANPVRTGYTFAGWYADQQGSGSVVTGATKVETAQEHNLFAKWTANTVDAVFTDTVHGNPSATLPQTFGAPYVFPADPTTTFATFAGWFTLPNGAGEQITVASTVAITATTTFYAHWEALGSVEAVYVLGYAGGTVPDPKLVEPGQTYGTLATVTRTGYDFGGWYFDNGTFANRVLGSTQVTETDTHNLYAKWTAKNVSVTFDKNPGGTYDTKTLKFDAAYELPASNPARGGYAFTGWFTAASGGSQVTAADTVATEGPVTLYAQWTAQAFPWAPGTTAYTMTNGVFGAWAFDPPVLDPGLTIESYSVSGGALPPGVTIVGTTFEGTPSAVGSYSATVTALGSNGQSTGAGFTFTVVASELRLPGHDGVTGNGDDIVAPPESLDPDSGYIVVGPGQVVDHADTDLPFEDPDNLDTIPEGSVVISPDQILRPGTNAVPPQINDDNRTVHLVPGNTIDIDQDGLPPWMVPVEGDWDPDTGIFTPDEGVPPGYIVPPGIGIDGDKLIVPGPDGEYGTEDDVTVGPAGVGDVDLETGIITVPNGAGTTTNGAPIIVYEPYSPSLQVPAPGLIPPGSLVLPDGVIIIPSYPHDDTPSINPDGTVEVGPGDIILVPPYNKPFVVPEPGGTFDPDIPGIHVPEEPPYIILVPSGVIFIEPDTVVMPGNDLDYGTEDDNVYISPVEIEDVDDNGNVHVEEGETVTVEYGKDGETVDVDGPAVILYPDGTIIKGNNGDKTPKDEDDDGLFEVLPGDEIIIPGITDPEDPFIVPELPGWPDKGVPYEFDPSIPGIIGGYPPGIYVIPDGPFITVPETIIFPGDDLDYGTDEDNVHIHPAGVDDLDDNGNVVVEEGDTVTVDYGDGTSTEVEGPAVILFPNGVIVKNTDDDGEVPVTNPDGTVEVDPGDQIIIPGVTDPDFIVPELPGDPDGPYIFDPTVPSITGGEPPVTILIPSGVMIDDNKTPENPDDDIVTFPGGDLDYTTPGDNVVIKPVNVKEDLDNDGNVHVQPGDEVEVNYGDGSFVDVEGPAVILYPDGTIVKNTDDDGKVPEIKDDGTVVVDPGDEIIIPGVNPDDPFIVPELPGQPNGPYIFDPEVPAITGGRPPVTVLVPSGVWIDDNGTEEDYDDDIITFPGKDLDYTTPGDNVTVNPVNGREDVDKDGNISVEDGDTVEVGYGDGSTVTVDGPAVILHPDGTIVQNNKDDEVPVVNPDGTVIVNPGDEIDIPGKKPFIVPEIPGDPEGPYIYDPTIPGVKGGQPTVVVLVPSGIIVEGSETSEIHDDRLIIPGHTDEPGDNIHVVPGGLSDVDEWGNVTIGEGQDVWHEDGSPFDDGELTVPPGSIITAPDAIVRPGNGPDPAIDEDGAILVNPGNTIDIDGDGLPPVEVTVPGWFDPETGTFTPYDPSLPPTQIPPGATTEEGGYNGFPGADGLLYTDDDLLVDGTPDGFGNILVGEDGGTHRDTGLPFDDGELTLPPGSIVTLPDAIVRPGEGADHPVIHEDNGLIAVYPGNTIDTDQDGIPPWVVQDAGTFDPEAGTFTEADDTYVVYLPCGVARETDDGTVTVPGPDGVLGTEDDICVPVGDDGLPVEITLPWGYVTVPEGSVPFDGNGLDLDPEVQPGSIITPEGDIIYAGTNDEVPPPAINDDGTITIWTVFLLTGDGVYSDGTIGPELVAQAWNAPWNGPALGAPVWPGSNYAFQNWLLDDGATVVRPGSGVVDATMNGASLFSIWRGLPYQVTLLKLGGTGGDATVTAHNGQALPTITVPARANYTFLGYFTLPSGGVQYYDRNGESAKDFDLGDPITMTAPPLYAQWTRSELTYADGNITVAEGTLVNLNRVFATAVLGGEPEATVTYTLEYGALPDGLSMNAAGSLVGVALLPVTAIGPYIDFQVIITAQSGSHATSAVWTIRVTREETFFNGHTDAPEDDIVYYGTGAIDANGNLVIRDGDYAAHRDIDLPFDDGLFEIPAGSIVADPDVIVRPGTGAADPSTRTDGKIKVVPGNTIDVDQDGLPPWTVTVPGIYDPVTGVFTPDDRSLDPALVPPGVIYLETEDAFILPGADNDLYGDYNGGIDDNVWISPVNGNAELDGYGNVIITNGTVTVEYGEDGGYEIVEIDAPAVVLYPDGSIVVKGSGDEPPAIDHENNTVEVFPGDEIIIPGTTAPGEPFVVPAIPGDVDGPYTFDPSIPGVIGGDPEVTVLIPSGVMVDKGNPRNPGDDVVIFPGSDLDYTTDNDNVRITPANEDNVDKETGSVIVEDGEHVDVSYGSGITVPVDGPAVILYPDGTIITGTDTLPGLNDDGTVGVMPGDGIYIPGVTEPDNPFIVPSIPGDDGPYTFDPEIPAIIGGDPLVIVKIPSGLVIEPGTEEGQDTVVMPGKDLDYATREDNVWVKPVDASTDVDEAGNVYIGDTEEARVTYGDPGDTYVIDGPAVVLFPDGTIVKGVFPDAVNEDGTVIVVPGNTIILPTHPDKPWVVPELPGDPGPYLFDPKIPAIIGGDPLVTVKIPEGVAIDDNGTPGDPDDDIITLPGPDNTLGTDDDVKVWPVNAAEDLDGHGNVIVGEDDTVNVQYGKDGDTVTVDGPALVLNPDGTIVRPGDGNELPTGNEDGTVVVNPGDTIDIPGVTDPDNPFVVPEIPGDPGPYTYDPTIPGIIGGDPLVTVLIPDGVIIDPGDPRNPHDDAIIMPGTDLDFTTGEDNVTIRPARPDDLDGSGNVSVDGDEAIPTTVTYGEGDDAIEVVVEAPALILYPDGTIVKNNNGDEVPVINDDGTIDVKPGDVVIIGTDPENPFVVPVIPGDPDGPYTFDPSIPAIIGGDPEVVIHLPSGTTDEGNGTETLLDDTVRVPGPDGKLFTDDDVVVYATPSGQLPEVILPFGYVLVPDGSAVRYGDGTVVVPDVPEGSVVLPNGDILRPNPVTNTKPVVDPSTGAITLLVQFTLTEGANFGQRQATVQLWQTYGQPVNTPAQADIRDTPAGRLFDVWLDNLGGVLLDGSVVNAALATQAFTSGWKNDPLGGRPAGVYVVTLEFNGGTGGTPSFTVKVGDNLVNNFLTAPSRAGYAFTGYYTAVVDGGQVFTSSMSGPSSWSVASDTTLYARWTARTFSYSTSNPVIVVQDGVFTNLPGVFDTIADPAYDNVDFTVGSGALPPGLSLTSGGGLVGAARLEGSGNSEYHDVVIVATDTHTGSTAETLWRIWVVKPGTNPPIYDPDLIISAIEVIPVDGLPGKFDVILRYPHTSGVDHYILGKTELGQVNWADVAHHAWEAGGSLEIGETETLIPYWVTEGDGTPFRFFRRMIKLPQ